MLNPKFRPDDRTIECCQCADHTLTPGTVQYPSTIDVNSIKRQETDRPLCRSCYNTWAGQHPDMTARPVWPVE